MRDLDHEMLLRDSRSCQIEVSLLGFLPSTDLSIERPLGWGFSSKLFSLHNENFWQAFSGTPLTQPNTNSMEIVLSDSLANSSSGPVALPRWNRSCRQFLDNYTEYYLHPLISRSNNFQGIFLWYSFAARTFSILHFFRVCIMYTARSIGEALRNSIRHTPSAPLPRLTGEAWKN